jgi:diguanylate cyclase (GGDEF)-like protein/putative nucleotidyltransferase with HDIG domain
VSLYDLAMGQIPTAWLVLAVLTLFSGSAPIRLHSIPVALSVSETFVFASTILFGSSAGTLTVALDAAVISFWSFRRGQPIYKVVFNVCALPLTIWLASKLFFLIADFPPVFGHRDSLELRHLLLPLGVSTIIYFLLSSWIITVAIALERRLPPFRIWRDNFAWISLNYFGGASIAAILVSYAKDFNVASLLIAVLLLPLLALLYATYSRTVGRVQDANRHLVELNTLYVSTIETLAMAIDAKDQVTHGHIRRVQVYAVGLAKHLGITEPALIQAIEAAALLHDMGKLAVPEYILNKPGPLTSAEFDRMKLHASIGADILSSINFPYPVVPIVRHHHENWDGTGYPDRLKATQIPMGARILSVVDCYDALTSDRPYRPRLSDAEATRILLTRRGTMYDPLVVDTFLKVYQELAAAASSGHTGKDASLVGMSPSIASPDALRSTSEGLQNIAASNEEMLVLYDLAQGLLGQLDLSDATDIISKHLRRIVPASTCVFFLHDPTKDELLAAHAFGENAPNFAGLRIPRGQRLTGWVAANKQTILNSDPVLDFGEVARYFRPQLRSCLSTPLVSDSQLVGVLSVYSTLTNAFTDDHRRLIEVIARQVSHTIKHASKGRQPDTVGTRDDSAGGLDRDRVERFVASEIGLAPSHSSLSVILVEISAFKSHSNTRASASVHPMEAVTASLARVLRGGDILCKYADDEFVIILTQTDPDAAIGVASRIAEIANTTQSESGPHSVCGVASAPEDGRTLAELVAAARARRRLSSANKMMSRPPAVH